MKAEEFAKQHYPKARVEHFNTRNVFDKKGYWIVWSSAKRHERRRLGESTKSICNAWVCAKKLILERIKDNEDVDNQKS